MLKSDLDTLVDIFQLFSGQNFIRQLWMATVLYKLSYFEKQSVAKKVFLKILQSSQETHQNTGNTS